MDTLKFEREGSYEPLLLSERPDMKKRPYAGALLRFVQRDGAKRARTADLLGAIQALSQLSYGPARPEV